MNRIWPVFKSDHPAPGDDPMGVTGFLTRLFDSPLFT